MSKTTVTHEHESHEPKSHGCGCGGAHATKEQKAQPGQKEQAVPSNDPKHEHAHHTDGDSGCCGGGKASK
jgi:hypothetical protein